MWRFYQNQDSWFHTWKTSWESKTVFHATQDWWFSQWVLYQTNWKIILPPQLLQNTWKNHVADVIRKAFESTPGDISTRSDYAETFGFDPDGQIQNEFFDNNRSLSMEGCCLDRFIKKVNVSTFYDDGDGGVHQYNDTVRNLFYIYLIQSCKMPLQQQLISIHYWQFFLRKNKW